MALKAYQLNSNVVSTCRPSVLYGRVGEKVLLIAEHGHIWIVEGPSGNRFPVPAAYVREWTEKKPDEKLPDNFQEIAKEVLPLVPDKIPTRKTKPAKIINQSSLF